MTLFNICLTVILGGSILCQLPAPSGAVAGFPDFIDKAQWGVRIACKLGLIAGAWWLI